MVNVKSISVFSIIIILGSIYKLAPNFTELKQPNIFYYKTKLSGEYERCLNLPYKALEARKSEFDQGSVELPVRITAQALSQLQVQDLCMRRIKKASSFNQIKDIISHKIKFSLDPGLLKVRYQDPGRIKNSLLLFYPNYQNYFDASLISKGIEQTSSLSLKEILYLCLAKHQVFDLNEEECFKYESKEDLIKTLTADTK